MFWQGVCRYICSNLIIIHLSSLTASRKQFRQAVNILEERNIKIHALLQFQDKMSL